MNGNQSAVRWDEIYGGGVNAQSREFAGKGRKERNTEADSTDWRVTSHCSRAAERARANRQEASGSRRIRPEAERPRANRQEASGSRRIRSEAERARANRQEASGSRRIRSEAERPRANRQEASGSHRNSRIADMNRNRRNAARMRQQRRRKAAGRFCLAAAAVVLWMAVLAALRGVPALLKGQMPGGKVLADAEQGAFAGENAEGINTEYPEILQELLEKNEETSDYVAGYGKREEYIGKPVDLTQDFVSGQVPLLMQWDRRWGYDPYGKEMIGLAGCGPLCLEMAYLYFTEDTSMTPAKMAQFAYDNGFYTESGTSWALWTEGTAKLGLEGKELSLDENRMKDWLDAGGLIVCSMWPGDFTSTGHFILIRGYGEDGFYVNDPNRRSTSGKVWDYETLHYQIRNLWGLRQGK